MFDTNIVVCGNVLAAPEWRRVSSTGALVANFRLASTSRRFERETGRWVDGNNLRVRVSAWRKLAEGVASSIMVGDPVIVYGRLYSRNWTDENKNNRISYEVEAYSIGHDLAKGRVKFFRSARADEETGEIEDAADEFSVPLTADEAPVGYGDGMPARLPDEDQPTFEEVVAGVEPSGAPDPDELTAEVERLTETPPEAPRRSRRAGAKREPVAA